MGEKGRRGRSEEERRRGEGEENEEEGREGREGGGERDERWMKRFANCFTLRYGSCIHVNNYWMVIRVAQWVQFQLPWEECG